MSHKKTSKKSTKDEVLTIPENLTNISGKNTDYEKEFKKIIITGTTFLKDNPAAKPGFKGDGSSYGPRKEDNEDAKDLMATISSEVDLKQLDKELVDTAIRHLQWIKKHGWEKYLEMLHNRQ